MNKKFIIALIFIITLVLAMFACIYFINIANTKAEDSVKATNTSNTIESANYEVNEKETEKYNPVIINLNNDNTNYMFNYNNEEFFATYTLDNWHINDSYKIADIDDIEAICNALIEIHPIHGDDLVSFRTAKDMASEWTKHNLLYMILPDESNWKNSAKDVDLDPYDQNKSLSEMYKQRTGKEFDYSNIDF